jgi:hypothetical protein
MLLTLTWTALMVPSSVMGLPIDAPEAVAAIFDHDGPHCPAPYAEVAPDRCQGPLSLIPSREEDSAQVPVMVTPPIVSVLDAMYEPVAHATRSAAGPPPCGGRRPHLVHAQFNE